MKRDIKELEERLFNESLERVKRNSVNDSKKNKTDNHDDSKLITNEKEILETILTQDERYHSQSKLGQGGMKNIVRVKDENMKRVVAKATIKPEKASIKNSEKLIHEAHIMASFKHPNIVPVYDIGENENGEPYFIMKYLDGLSLKDIIEMKKNNHKKILKKFTLNKLLELFNQLCSCMSYVHDQGIIHLDLKPDNIFITNDDEVYILDWGFSKILNKNSEEEPIDKNLNGVRTVCGTPAYISPEQVLGKEKWINKKTDIYGLGGILYTILCYDLPIKGGSIQEMYKNALSGNIISPIDNRPDLNIDIQLANICIKALSREPSKRYKEVELLEHDLNTFLLANNKKEKIKRSLMLAVSLSIMLVSLTTYFVFDFRSPEEKMHSLIESKNPKYTNDAVFKYDENKKIIGLDLRNNQSIQDISFLENVNLNYLNVSGTKIENIKSLSGVSLKELYLHNTNVNDLTPLIRKDIEVLSIPEIWKLKMDWRDVLFSNENLKFIGENENDIKIKQRLVDFYDQMDGKLVWWTFDKLEKGQKFDSVKNVMIASTEVPMDKVDLVDGKFGKAINFNNKDLNFVSNIGQSIKTNHDITISLWVKIEEFKSNSAEILIHLAFNTEEQLLLGLRSGHPILYSLSKKTIIQSKDHIKPNTWNHYVYTYSNKTHKIYINGQLIDEKKMLIKAHSVVHMSFGGHEKNHFTGYLDEVRFYTYALSQEEVGVLYNIE